MVKITFVGIWDIEKADNTTLMNSMRQVRHGESVDNLKDVWAGWKDSQLTNHGMKQAETLALSFSSVPFAAIYTSDLSRAHLTAKAIHATQPKPSSSSSSSRPSLSTTPSSALGTRSVSFRTASKGPPAPTPLHATDLLREQSFGVGEGKSYKVARNKGLSLPQHFARNIFPTLYGRQERFPGGESKEDMSMRAKRFLDDVIMPYVCTEEKPEDEEEQPEEERSSDDSDILFPQAMADQKAKQEKRKENRRAHLCIVSHGLFIPELIVLMAIMDDKYKSGAQDVRNNVKGMRNTDWTRVEFGFEKSDSPCGTIEKSLRIKFTHVKAHPHLDKLQRQKGGISRVAYDPSQKDIRSFFGR